MKLKTKNWSYLFVVGTFLMIAGGCKKDNLNQATVTTALNSTPASLALDPNSVVVVTGNITSDGGKPITERGVCYKIVASNAQDLKVDPTLDNCIGKVVSTTTSQKFSAKVSVVNSGYYYVRAYVKNSNGTFYGNTVAFQGAGSGVATSDAKAQAVLLKSTQDDVTALKQKVEEHGKELIKKINGIDFQALSNTVADLAKSDEEKLNKIKSSFQDLIAKKLDSADFAKGNNAIHKLLEAKLNSADFVAAKNTLESLINTKVGTDDLASAKAELKSLINNKMSTDDFANARNALEILINAKASTQDLTNAKTELSSLIDTKVSTQELENAKAGLNSLINTKLNTQDLTNAKTALESLIDAKASQTEFDAAKRKLSQIEKIILNINPISSLATTELANGTASIAITLDHISIDPTVTKPFTEIKKLEYVCFESNKPTPAPSDRKPVSFDPNAVADGETTIEISQPITNIDAGRMYKFIVYATMVGGNKVHSGRATFTAR